MSTASFWGLLLIEGSILISALIIVLYLRRALKSNPKRSKSLSGGKKGLESNVEKINQLLKESESLSLNLSNNLGEKREIVKKLVETLDERIDTLSRLLAKIEGKVPDCETAPEARDGKGQIVQMALAGCEVADIAKRLGLSKEEVQLILDLRKITSP